MGDWRSKLNWSEDAGATEPLLIPSRWAAFRVARRMTKVRAPHSLDDVWVVEGLRVDGPADAWVTVSHELEDADAAAEQCVALARGCVSYS